MILERNTVARVLSQGTTRMLRSAGRQLPSRAGSTLCAPLAALLVVLVWSHLALAGVDQVLLLPTLTRYCDGRGKLHRPLPDQEPQACALVRQLDANLGEAAQDLGLTLQVTKRPLPSPAELTEQALVAQAADRWVVSPRLEIHAEHVRLKILAVPPGSQVVLVRTEKTTLDQLEIRALVVMRDLIVAGRGVHPEPALATVPPAERNVVAPARSEGRAVLALNGAALGGFAGLSLQKASGSDDARLLYPLIALGTGVGLGASMIAASEWDIGLGDAWFISAGLWWPTASGLLLANYYDVQPVEDRYLYGLGAGLGGLALATTAVSHAAISPGGATLAHSGGAWGTLLGGLVELYFEGETDLTPSGGMGYGAGLGVLAGGILATGLEVKPGRVLLMDLVAALGGLTGAAVASPAVFGEERSHAENRIWLASIAGGTLAGATVGYFITQSSLPLEVTAGRWAMAPYFGVVATGIQPHHQPLLGGGLRGEW